MRGNELFDEWKELCSHPEPYSAYTTDLLWTDGHVSKKMLEMHLDPGTDLASRRPEFIDRSVSWMKGRFRIGPGVRIGDFGCGPGLYTNRFAGLGAQVTGIDFSQRSLNWAGSHANPDGPAVEYVLADYLAYEAPPESFDLICLIYCDLCPLSPDRLATLLCKFRRFLAPGGRLFFDVSTHHYFDTRSEGTDCEWAAGGGFWSGNPYFCLHNTFKYGDRRLLLDKFTIVESDRTRSIFNWLQCFDKGSLRNELAAAELEIEEICGDVAGGTLRDDSDCMAVVARRRN